jgi:hypothetical protein
LILSLHNSSIQARTVNPHDPTSGNTPETERERIAANATVSRNRSWLESAGKPASTTH